MCPTWRPVTAVEELNNDLDGLDTVLQEIRNYEFNNDIVNNMSASASVQFPQLKDLFTSATINGNMTINFK
jgi:hypothetical protein